MKKLNLLIELVGKAELNISADMRALIITLANSALNDLKVIHTDSEILIPTPAGEVLAIPVGDLTYVRFIDSNNPGIELFKVTASEIEDDPIFILGSIFGAFLQGAKIEPKEIL